MCVVTVSVGNLTEVIGVQGFNDVGVTDESDFHNSLIPVQRGAKHRRGEAGRRRERRRAVQFNDHPGSDERRRHSDDSGQRTPATPIPAPGQPSGQQRAGGHVHWITETVAPLGYMIDADPTRPWSP